MSEGVAIDVPNTTKNITYWF